LRRNSLYDALWVCQMAHFDQLVPLLATVAVTACADARSPAQMAPSASGSTPGGVQWVEETAPRDGCSVRVVFGSFATGPDTLAMRLITGVLAADPAVTQVTRSPYGREGEHSLCIRTPNRSAATRLFNDLESAVRGPVSAPVTIVGPDRSFVIPSVAKAGQRR
jgi:hypothetical protein